MKEEDKEILEKQCGILWKNGNPDCIDYRKAITAGMINLVEDILASQKQELADLILAQKPYYEFLRPEEVIDLINGKQI